MDGAFAGGEFAQVAEFAALVRDLREEALRVYRSRTGGNEWEALTKGLPQRNCYVNV